MSLEKSSGPFRLSHAGRIDRSEAVRFYFDGTAYDGYRGDTVASALLANGLRTVGRSFKFHRPRGIFSAGLEEPNALVQLNSGAYAVPSARATQVELTEGLQVHSQSGWPSRKFDVGRALDLVAPLWSAGFYNKTFMWPSWHTYEGAIRALAGLGRVPEDVDPDRYELRNLHCEVLVVGGGVAGLAAAAKASRPGVRVVLAHQGQSLGGRCEWDGSNIEQRAARDWVADVDARLSRMQDVTVLTRTTAVGYYDHDIVTLLERVPGAAPGAPRERYWIVRPKRIVLATGAMEQPMIFANNDRPGIMQADAMHEYALRYGVGVGRRVLLATNNDSAYATARALKEALVNVIGVVDTRAGISEALAADMRASGIPVMLRSIPVNTAGFSALRRVTVGQLSADSSRVKSSTSLACDALGVSGGWSPTLHLYAHAGGKLAYDELTGALRPVSAHPTIHLAGAAAGITDPTSVVQHASEAGEAAALAARPGSPSVTAEKGQHVGPRVCPVGNTRRQWVDLLHDVTVSDLELALRENYTSVEHVKRYTTLGMAADQGKTSAALSIQTLARLRNLPAAALGHTTFRPPFIPATLGAIAGRELGDRFAPRRRLPLHEWHVRHGALIHDFGEWQRPVVYLHDGESRPAAVEREIRLVRTAVGLFDGSPIGKLEVHGPDACAFLDRFYINDLTTLKPGRARYGLMLLESGVIFDDGTITLLAPNHFLVTTTSGNVGRVAAWMQEWHQCEWPHLKVAVTPVTDHWSTIALTGPRSREILSTLQSDLDLSNEAFPHLGVRTGHVLGRPARVFRVSFSGELTYEINTPAVDAQRLWDALLEAGRPFGIEPFGLDALLAMRMEKGFLHIGTDTDGTSVPDDVGWGKVAAKKAADFIGKRSLWLPENVRADRLQLIGLAGTPGTPIHIGSHLRVPGSSRTTDGWVTSAGVSSESGAPIALALLRAGRSCTGTSVTVHDLSGTTQARVVELPFLDSTGVRMQA